MSKPAKMTDAEVQQRLGSLKHWTLEKGKLHRAYKFADFVNAFAFMTQGALAAEALNHHPEWSNVWNKVVVDLNTHDAGGITDLDFTLAERMEKAAAKLM